MVKRLNKPGSRQLFRQPQIGEDKTLRVFPLHIYAIKSSVAAFFCAVLLGCFQSTNALAADGYQIVTGPRTGTYYAAGKDLAEIVGASAALDLSAVATNGSVENLKRLRSERGVRLALVQADALKAFTDLAASGNKDVARLIDPLRIVLPLYNDEIHVVVRADSPLKSIHEIRGKRLNIGPLGSGTSVSAVTLYRAMFQEEPPATNITTMPIEDALKEMANNRAGIEVVFVTTGQPGAVFANMRPSVDKLFKLLALDKNAPESARALQVYAEGVLRAQNYPMWLRKDVPTLSVRTLLMTYDYKQKSIRSWLERFADSMCEQATTLRSKGHPKWQQVAMPFQLPPVEHGWRYYGPTEERLKRCAELRPASVPCDVSDKVLGLCVPNAADQAGVKQAASAEK